MKSTSFLSLLVAVLVCLALLHSSSCADEAAAAAATADTEVVPETEEKFRFKAEINQLLSLIIHSLYTKRDIFLRELISNASDALDKIRFSALTDKSALGDVEDLEIRIRYDAEAKTISIRDTGLGMTREHLANNLGTIAKSGTAEFVQKLREGADMDLIGQFGVGFYSAFLVADRVIVTSKHNDDPHQHIWESTADNSFTIKQDNRGEEFMLGRGTDIKLLLKDDAEEFLADGKLRELIEHYSEFIGFPIYLYESHKEEREVEIEAEEEEEEEEEEVEETTEAGDEEDDEEVSVDEDDDDDDEEDDGPKTKIEEIDVWDWQQINSNKPIWTRDPAEITEEEYNNFYKAISKTEEDPLTKVHFKVDGAPAFKAVLYIPSKVTNKAYDVSKTSSNIAVYVKRVFITDSFEELMPSYLNFIKGVVDSDDFPLNVSREILQESGLVKKIRRYLIKRILQLLKKMSDEDENDGSDEEEELEETTEDTKKDPEESSKAAEEDEETESKYITFWKEYGKHIRLGVIQDPSMRNRLKKLLRYKSSKSGAGYVSLAQYMANMPEEQKDIYYITGENMEVVEGSPLLERLNELGYEVLYFIDPIDEYTLPYLDSFDSKKLVDITREGHKFDDSDDEKAAQKKLTKKYKKLTKWLKKTLKPHITKAVVSARLSETPCIIVSPKYGLTANMERLLEAQAFATKEMYAQKAERILEINPRHPVIIRLRKLFRENPEDATAKRLAFLLYDTGSLQSGFKVHDQKLFARRVHEMMALALDINPDEPDDIEEDEEVEPVKEEPASDTKADAATEATETTTHDEL